MPVDGLHHPDGEVHVDTLGLDAWPASLLQVELTGNLLASIRRVG
jgi:hypothetical protein